jgi:hypothetical protein
MLPGAALVAVSVSTLVLAGCGGGKSGAVVTTTQPPVPVAVGDASLAASGPVAGVFDRVTECSVSRGGGRGLLVVVKGTLGGSAATLTIDQDPFAAGAYTYPRTSTPASAGDLGSDVIYDHRATGAWHFYPVQPAGLVGGAGGRISVVEKKDDTLDATVHAKFGTTDADGPLLVEGDLTCTEQP